MEDLKFELHLTFGETNLILSALAELPFKVSFALIQKIKQQGEQQADMVREQAAESAAPPPGGSSNPA